MHKKVQINAKKIAFLKKVSFANYITNNEQYTSTASNNLNLLFSIDF